MRNLIISIFAGAISSIVFMTIHVKVYQKSIGVIQLESIISSHMKEYASRDFSEEQRKEVSGRFANLLDSAIKEVSEKHQVILLVSPAVVTAEPDYTGEVKAVIEKGMADFKKP